MLNQIQSSAGYSVPFGDLGGLISAVLPYIFYGAGILLLVYMVLGGFQMMTSRGEPKVMAAAQAKITNALIGFVIVLISAGLVIIIGRILNIPIFANLF